MKKIIIALLCILNSSVFAQKVSWGPLEKESKKINLIGIIGKDKDFYYNLKSSNKLIGGYLFLEKLNKDLIVVSTKTLDLNYQDKKLSYENLLLQNGELLLFTSFQNQKDKIKYLFVQHINLNTLEAEKDMKKIAEIDYSDKGKHNTGHFRFSRSRDTTKLLVYYNPPYDRKEYEKFGLHVFDKSNKEIWKKEITLPYLSNDFSIKKLIVDNDANVYALGKKYMSKAESKSNQGSDYTVEIFSYTKNGSYEKKYELNIGERYVNEVALTVNDDKELICAGFYGDNGSSNVSGTFFLKINPETKRVIKESYKKFDIEFITENMTEKQEAKTKKRAAKGKNVDLYEYDLREILIKEDGGVVLIGEQFYIRVVTTTSTDANGNTRTTTTYYYYYNDIIVVNIDGKGDIDWAKKIPKRQVTTNDGGYYSSYSLSVVEDKLYFIFNDHLKNILEPEQGILRNFTGRKYGAVAVVTMDTKGNQKREVLFATNSADVIIRPKVCKQVTPNSTILFGIKTKSRQYAKVTF